MKIYPNDLKQKLEVVVEHAGHKLIFLANVFTRKSLCGSGFDVFEQINAYWAGLPMQRQDEIFEVYKDADAAFDIIDDTKVVYTILNNCIRRLLQLHPLDNLEFWLASNPTICVPDSVKELPPDPSENMFTKEKTYTRMDYFPLLTLSMFLRTVLPIWGQYIESIRKNSEMNRKEFIAMQLLNGTGILECVAMNRLRVYIDAAVNSDDIDYGKILDSFSSEDMGFLFLSLVCVKRLCLGDLRGIDNKTQLVATIFKFMAQKTFNQPESDVMLKKENLRDDAGGADSGKHSILETYRKRTELSLGEIAELEYALSDVVGIAQRLEPTLTEEEIQFSIQTAQSLKGTLITDAQTVLAGEMIKDQITPHALHYVSQQHIINLLGALEAVLWKWGYHYLALIITAHAIVDVEEVTVGNISSREQIDQSLIDQLKVYYPYEWSTIRKGDEIIQPHPVVLSIDHMVDYLTFHAYRATASEDRLQQVFGEIRRKITVFSDIKNILARLIISIEERHAQRSISSNQIQAV